MEYDRNCRRCPRLAGHLARVRELHPDYHAAPVPAFGASDARLLIVGLAPGMRGANRFGRPFTGDASARTLVPALARAGFANQPTSCAPGDGLALIDCRITNAVKCLPPGNRPTAEEIRNCSAFLAEELRRFRNAARDGARRRLRGRRCMLALGRIAHDAVIQALEVPRLPFAHGATYNLTAGLVLADCYHPSPQNVHTRRLTPAMLDEVLARIRRLLDDARTDP